MLTSAVGCAGRSGERRAHVVNVLFEQREERRLPADQVAALVVREALRVQRRRRNRDCVRDVLLVDHGAFAAEADDGQDCGGDRQHEHDEEDADGEQGSVSIGHSLPNVVRRTRLHNCPIRQVGTGLRAWRNRELGLSRRG
jgi:hypothetical protein